MSPFPPLFLVMGSLGNQKLAATPENQVKWAEIHNVTKGRFRNWVPTKKGMVKGGKLFIAGVAIELALGSSLEAAVENSFDPFGPSDLASEYDEIRWYPTINISLVHRKDTVWWVGVKDNDPLSSLAFPSFVVTGSEEVLDTYNMEIPKDMYLRKAIEVDLNRRYGETITSEKIRIGENKYLEHSCYYFRVEYGSPVFHR